jgi:hypothetical protein
VGRVGVFVNVSNTLAFAAPRSDVPTSVLAGQLHVFRPRADLLTKLVVLTPLIGAVLIAGSFLGFLIAYSTYRRYYPALHSRRCSRPYARTLEEEKRAWEEMDEEDWEDYHCRSVHARPGGFAKLRGEEDALESSDDPEAAGGLDEDNIPLRTAM